jgi:hypothetical protein
MYIHPLNLKEKEKIRTKSIDDTKTIRDCQADKDRVLRSQATESIQYISIKLISEELPLHRGFLSSLYPDSNDRYLFDANRYPIDA